MVCGVRPTGITMQTIRSPRKAIPTQLRADEMRPSLVFSLRLVAPALLVMLFGCGGGSSSTAVNPPPGGPPALGLSAFVSGVASPVGMEVPNDGRGRLLVVNQPFDNHNGGQLAFGPDGFLYIGLGDGGSEGDPQGNGQNLQTLLGKILRIDVDGAFAPGKQYAIPADNPFTPPGGLPEIWAYGLRNPWRFSFDRATGKLFAGDVGQNSFEEVDIITKAGNFGWNKMEASHCYPPGSLCSTAGLILPIMEYAHNASGGKAIIGGFFYLGSSVAGRGGAYVFGDLFGGHILGGGQGSSGNLRQKLGR